MLSIGNSPRYFKGEWLFSLSFLAFLFFLAVLGIRFRRIRMFLALQDPDPDPLVGVRIRIRSRSFPFLNNGYKTGFYHKTFKIEDNVPLVKL
jgi:hypothetical protein